MRRWSGPLKVDTRLEDLRIDLGETGEYLLDALRPPGADLVKALDGACLKKVLSALRWAGVSPEKLAGLDETSAKMFARVDKLQGKRIRITYRDGVDVLRLEPIHGEMTAEERDFHFAGVLLSDALIIPNVDIPRDIRWTVDAGWLSRCQGPSIRPGRPGPGVASGRDSSVGQWHAGGRFAGPA
jgi:hypothetical protein